MMRTLRPADSSSIRTINQGWEKSCPFIFTLGGKKDGRREKKNGVEITQIRGSY